MSNNINFTTSLDLRMTKGEDETQNIKDNTGRETRKLRTMIRVRPN
ncbi:MAG TPA: hypothetical protein VEL11_14295 [Candidatus Bathyarchaeia archaeon]|nr:hypothetical protein [Candidatus Bathyarchaeia archaeon]